MGNHVDHGLGEPGIGDVGRRHQELPGQEERVPGTGGCLVVGAAGKGRQSEGYREGYQRAEAAIGDRAYPCDPQHLIISRQALKLRPPYPRIVVLATIWTHPPAKNAPTCDGRRRADAAEFRRTKRWPRRRRLPVRAQEIGAGHLFSPTSANVRFGS